MGRLGSSGIGLSGFESIRRKTGSTSATVCGVAHRDLQKIQSDDSGSKTMEKVGVMM
jgi:hypothetical protein